jgi:transmembrane sensor
MLALRHETLSSLVVRPAAQRWGRVVAAGVAVVLLAATATFLLLRSPAPPGPVAVVAQRAPDLYQTAVGERLDATLPDGSRVTLNTDSRLRVAYDGRERRLVLERGQALFEVAHGQPRPFVVLAAGQRITATGTVFDVRLERDNQVRVTLVEGRVLVRADRPGTRVTTMQPSEVLLATATAATVAREPEVEHVVSWRNGMLIFENDSLAEAVAEMNRYVRRPIVLEDPGIGRIRVSGAFRTGETDAFIEALELSFPVRVVERRGDAIVLAPRS